MNTHLVGQRHMQLTNPFGTSAGVSLSGADLASICTHQRSGSGKQLTPWSTRYCRFHTHRTPASHDHGGWQLQIAIVPHRLRSREGSIWPRGFLPWRLYDAHP